MARAKRTDRAEARRRYRATLIEESLPLDPDSDSSAEPDAADGPPADRSRNRAAATTSVGPPPRPNIFGAMRAAFHPTDLRGDLAGLPRLLVHRAFLIPLALIVGMTALLLVTGGREQISLILAPYFLAPPPVVPVFIAGFLAPRASYVLGGLLGAISMIASIALLSSPALQPATGAAAAVSLEPVVVANSFLTSVVFGAVFAAVAAWYKRFLALANPSRAARAAGKPADRSRRRGGDDRPLLARRR